MHRLKGVFFTLGCNLESFLDARGVSRAFLRMRGASSAIFQGYIKKGNPHGGADCLVESRGA